MPSVRPRISWLPAADLSQIPSCIFWVLSGSRRARATISPMTSSTTLRVLENGALKTATPRDVASARSTWLVPMQKQPTARRSRAASRRRGVIVVFDRMPRRATPWRASMSSSSPIERGCVSTSKPALRSPSAATWWMFSRRSAFAGSGGAKWIMGTRLGNRLAVRSGRLTPVLLVGVAIPRGRR
ncbi:hypothetical protein BN12_540013 [Nostocoides japonicum T1-X7]|uniref:Uncharacterized protein n=1 Tax=Nostocoides japonicum T1-X7 TaxID=1194083 RepID=A0A077M6P2_9MICO|nr:hypothetical protein BN12_540013 [Tetrasphaera japonica T1-X7]